MDEQAIQKLVDLDRRHVWHPFTPMRQWREHDPIIIERADGDELIDVRGRRYIDEAGTGEPLADPTERLLGNIERRMLKRRVDALKSLPTFPASIVRINEMLVDQESDESFSKIAAVVETDPILVARVLRLVNAAFYGVSGTVVTADRIRASLYAIHHAQEGGSLLPAYS